MNPINQDEFNELVAQNNERGIHISLFMPLEREPDKHQMNQIRFKNFFKPLLPLLNSYDRFYLLSLSQNQVQLWHGTKFSLEPVEVPNLPKDMAEALALEDPEQRGLNFRANPEGRDSRFRSAMIQPYFEQTRLTAVAQYENGYNSGLASDDLAEIVFAAHAGRVDTLFIPPSEPQWGTFDPETGEVELCETAVIYCEDLQNRAATDTVANGGTVYLLPPKEIPENASAAALFRYVV